MITYLDASALAKYFIEEEGTSEVRALVADTLPATSRLSAVEVTSAICRRWREGHITETDRDHALERLETVMAGLYVIELTSAITESAQQLLRRFALRAGDSIQLASFLAIRTRIGKGVQFSAFDNRLADAAERASEVLDPP